MKKAVSIKLMIRVKTDRGYRYVHPVYDEQKRKNAHPKLKPFYALANGEEQHHPEGVYALRIGRDYISDNAWSRDAERALTTFKREQNKLDAKAAGVEVLDDDGVPATLKETVERYLEQLKPAQSQKRDFSHHVALYLTETQGHKEHRTYLAYKLALTRFCELCQKTKENPSGKTHLEDLDRNDVMHFIATLRGNGQHGKRTVRNIINNLKTFFLHFNLTWPLKPKDMPKYTKKQVQAYDGEDILELLRSATVDEMDLICFFLWTGGREQDVQYARWTSINFHRNTFWIKEDEELGFVPKDGEEAGIPLPSFLVARLAERKKRFPESSLLFPSKTGKPDGHILRRIKDVALRAGLNCGLCLTKPRLKQDGTFNVVQSCKQHPVCKLWTLHQFRRTFATFHHMRGVPVNTIRAWLRHSELETTLRYLASIEATENIERIKAVSNILWSGDFFQKPKAA